MGVSGSQGAARSRRGEKGGRGEDGSNEGRRQGCQWVKGEVSTPYQPQLSSTLSYTGKLAARRRGEQGRARWDENLLEGREIALGTFKRATELDELDQMAEDASDDGTSGEGGKAKPAVAERDS